MISDELWNAYCATVVTFASDIGELSTIYPSDEHGHWPFENAIEQVFIISAANPFSDKLSDQVNHAARLELASKFDSLGIKFLSCEGRSPDGNWIEPSLLVLNVEEDLIRELGEEFKQNAIFRWTPLAWECISLISSQHYSSGWTLSNSIA